MAIRKTGKTFKVEGYKNGRRFYKSGLNSISEAKRWQRQMLARLDHDPNLVEYNSTYEDLESKFIESHLPTVRKGTADRYLIEIKYRIQPMFKYLKLSKISSGFIEEFKSLVMTELSNPKSVNNCLDTLRLMLNKAVKWEMLAISPFKIDRLKVQRIYSENWWDEKRDLFDFIGVARNTSRYFPAYLLALESGMRVGEIVGLSKSDIDFKAGRIRVWRQWLDKYLVYGPCKHDVERWVDFDPDGELSFQLKLAISKSPHPEAIFVSENGVRVQARKLAGSYFSNLIKKSGVPRITFHGLRHTFASWYMREMDDLWALKSILGHSIKRPFPFQNTL